MWRGSEVKNEKRTFSLVSTEEDYVGRRRKN